MMKRRLPLIFAVLLGAALLGFIGYGVAQLGRGGATGNLATEGVIVRREFTPAPPEEQITFGREGLSAKKTSGEHVFLVRTPDGREFRVPVDEATFAGKREGERFLFRRAN